MNTTYQYSSQVRNIFEAPASFTSIPVRPIISARKESSISIVDSTEMELFSLMSLAGTDDAAILYMEKGEVTLVHDQKTFILTKGMLLYKNPETTLQLSRFSEDCHFKVFCFPPQFEIAGGMPITHLETITAIASNNPVLTLDTLTAATVTVLFWLLQKKLSWGEKAPSADETKQYVFSLLMLEVVSSFKKNIVENPGQYSRKVVLTFQFLEMLPGHIKEQRNVHFFAGLLHVTPKYLSTCVKEITGKNCRDIIGETALNS